MGSLALLPLLFLWPSDGAGPGFAERQRTAPRVVAARQEHGADVRRLFSDKGLAYPAKVLLVRAFKHEGELEVWAGASASAPLTLVKTYPICARSGRLGPKRRQGDLQVPEGVYKIDRFNAWSSYHLSLGVDYPNASDRALGERPLGGDIFIHGDCVTIGCIPIEDEPIEELYLMALDARLAGGRAVVHIFPRRLSEAGLAALLREERPGLELRRFWEDLAPIYRAFEDKKVLPRVRIDAKGRYVVRR